jgi:hypothetical protein
VAILPDPCSVSFSFLQFEDIPIQLNFIKLHLVYNFVATVSDCQYLTPGSFQIRPEQANFVWWNRGNMSRVVLICGLLLCLQCTCICGLSNDVFSEELYIKNLPTGHVYTHFQFTTVWNVTLGAKDACKL